LNNADNFESPIAYCNHVTKRLYINKILRTIKGETGSMKAKKFTHKTIRNIIVLAIIFSFAVSGVMSPLNGMYASAIEFSTFADDGQSNTDNGKSGTDDEIKDPESIKLIVSGEEDYDYAYQVLDIVNEIRVQQGLNELLMDKSLLETAMLRAAEISIYFDNIRPNDEDCFSVYREPDFSGENIAMGYTSPEEVMDGWVESEDQYSNIVDPEFTSIGIGCFADSYGYYWVQCFDGNDSIAPEITDGKKSSVRNVVAKLKNLSGDSGGIIELSCAELNKVHNLKKYLNYDMTDFLFESSDTGVAEVDAVGDIIFKAPGTVNIIAVSKNNSQEHYIRSFIVKEHSCILTNVMPSETQQGYTNHVCSQCGSSWNDNYLPKLEPVNPNPSNVVLPNTTGNATVKKAAKPSKVKWISAKNLKREKISLKWKTQKECHYQFQISTKKNFKKNKKSGVTFDNSMCFYKLKKGKTYYVRVRAGMFEGSKKINGPWSTVRKIKIKK